MSSACCIQPWLHKCSQRTHPASAKPLGGLRGSRVGQVFHTCFCAAPPSSSPESSLSCSGCNSTSRALPSTSTSDMHGTHAVIEPLSGVQSAESWHSGFSCISMLCAVLRTVGGVSTSQDVLGDDNGDSSAIRFCSCKQLVATISPRQSERELHDTAAEWLWCN